MGTKYSTVTVSGYNATPPSDDGTVSEANKVKWSTIKEKLPDPLKTAIEAVDSRLQTHFNVGPTALTSNTTLGASHYNQIIQVSGASVTLTLSDAATLGAGWYTRVVNTDSSNNTTIGRATAGDTINGSAANFTLTALHGIDIFVNAAANGFFIRSVVTNPATTDTTQTFTGSKTFSNITVTGGSISGITDLPIADGGTGASTAANARTNLGLGALATANSVNQGTIDNAAIGQGELKSTTGSQSTAQASGAEFTVTLTGGTYSWWTASTGVGPFGFGGSVDSAAGVLGFINDTAGTNTIYLDERYIQASPPYNKEFYAYVGLDGSGNILHVSVAPDPIHAYHGPTNITPEYRVNGKSYRRIRYLDGKPFRTAIKDQVSLRKYLEGELVPEMIEQELTPDFKDADISLVPHPFLGYELSGVTIVLLHGVMLSRFVEMCDAEDAPEVRKIVENYLKIDNTPNGAVVGCPPGVLPVNCKWKIS